MIECDSLSEREWKHLPSMWLHPKQLVLEREIPETIDIDSTECARCYIYLWKRSDVDKLLTLCGHSWSTVWFSVILRASLGQLHK